MRLPTIRIYGRFVSVLETHLKRITRLVTGLLSHCAVSLIVAPLVKGRIVV